MPHLLIAGATGTGKSVSIHAMVASILFKATADDVRFILIDPKMLELSVYDGIPHLLVPVVVDLEKAAAALQWATGEMEARYRVMRELGVRNLDSYNRSIGQSRKPLELRRATLAENAGDDPQEGDTPRLRRLHGPFVSEAEIRKICDFLRAQGSPDYQMEIVETSATGGDDSSHSGERDELYHEALRIVLDTGQASISMIQRRLRIGYNRA